MKLGSKMGKTSQLNIRTISELHEAMGYEKPHNPLVTVIDFTKIDFSKHKHFDNVKLVNPFYTVFFKSKCPGEMMYGRTKYDFKEGSILCMSPGQVTSFSSQSEEPQADGFGLFFLPELIAKYPLAEKIENYTYFSYDANEALHLSDKEKQILTDNFTGIKSEIEQNIDAYSQDVIVSNIDLLLNYLNRFYGRQFLTRSGASKDILTRFDNLLKLYYRENRQVKNGIPNLDFFSENLNLSRNYLSDLMKKETGMSASDHIRNYIIDKAKTMLLSSSDSVSEIAYDIGFEYPQYFSKLFKQSVGMTPMKFRTSRN
jgi:AraC-like DNA-binding protein